VFSVSGKGILKGVVMSAIKSLIILLLIITAFQTSWVIPGADDLNKPTLKSEIKKTDSLVSESTSNQGLLGAEILISKAPGMTETDRFKPSVAANWVRGEYLVVWHNKWPNDHRDIYARRVSQNGDLLSWFAITTGTNDRLQPAVAYNAADAEYLVVWMHDVSGTGTQYEIWGKIIAWDGSYQKPEFKIISWPGRTFWTPRVVWNHNRNQYFVVWSAFDTSTMQPTDVSSMLLDSDGNLVTGRVLTTSTSPHQVDVAYGWAKDEYFVVFVRGYTQVTTGNDIYGLRVSHDNAVVSPPGVIEIHSGPKNQNGPSVTADGNGDYIVVWEHEYLPTDNDIYGRKFDKNGNPVEGNFIISNWPQDESSPAIAASFDDTPEYLAVWQREMTSGTIIAARRWGDGLVTRWFDVTSGVFWEDVNPIVVANPPKYFISYEGDSTGDPTIMRHIYGRTWDANAIWLPMVGRN
jgi:hypothetical protein